MDKIYNKIKKYISAKYIFLITFAVILGIIFWDFGKIWSFPDTNWLLAKGKKEKIKTEAVQKFQASRDGLSHIKILFGNSDVSPGGTFTFNLMDENCEKNIREVKKDIISLNSDNTTNFIFPKIDDSKDKIYCLKLSYTQQPGGKKAEIFLSNRVPQVIYFSVNGKELADKSMPMRPAYKNATIFGDINELNQRVSQYKPWFLKHFFLYFIAFGFIILSVVLVAILIIA